MPSEKLLLTKDDASKNKISQMTENRSDDISDNDFEAMRTFKRRTFVWPAILYVNEFEFKCMLYDISLGGVHLKLDLPLAVGATVKIKIKSFDVTEAIVAWHIPSFVGLKFCEGPQFIKTLLSDYAKKLV